MEKKNSYTGHRQFLPCNDLFRKQKKAFNGEQEFRPLPQILSGKKILRKINVICNSWGGEELIMVNPKLAIEIVGRRS